MLEIHKIEDNNTKQNLISNYNSELEPSDLFIGVYINNKVEEFIAYTICDKSTIIKYISNNTGDFQIVLGAVKTLLFLSDLQSVDEIILPLNYERISKALGFKNNNTHYKLNLSEYSSKCK